MTPTPGTDAYTYEFLWGDVHVNVISHAADEVEHTDRGAVCAVMYRHDTHTQTLMPLNVDSVVAVAPAGVDFSDPARPRVRPGVPPPTARAPRAVPRHVALGTVPARVRGGADVQRAGQALRRGQRIGRPRRAKAGAVFEVVT